MFLIIDDSRQEKQDPTSVDNKRAAIINNFYVSNMMHDISYAFGFDEASGNFQQKNFGKGGAEGISPFLVFI